MASKKTDQKKSVTSKLPRNLKPYFEEMDLIDRFGPKLIEPAEGQQALEILAQLLVQKYDESVDFYLFRVLDPEKNFHCELARVAGRLKKDPADLPTASMGQTYDRVMQQKAPVFLNASLLGTASAAMLIPMLAGQEVVGLMHLQSDAGERLTAQDVFFLGGLARLISPTFINSPQPFKLNEIYDVMVEAWGSAVDQHEGEMEGHCLRVADLTRRFALRIGVRGERLTALWRGAMLHDLGKMGISDTILFKESTLDLKEWEEMRRHPTFAYDILRRVPFLRDSLDIPYCHHEKWDGSGYPRGLRGEEIPLVARIYALVDVWDALLSERPYRSAWKRETAVEFLRNNLGSHFDPVLGAEFLKLIDEEGLG